MNISAVCVPVMWSGWRWAIPIPHWCRIESFGPLVVMMAARDIDHTLELCNSVPHGLVTTLFSNDAVIQQRVTQDAQTGIISINLSPLAIDPAAPFGGWKASGIGLPEHGQWDKAFYTKPQAVYGMQVIPAHLSLLKEE